MPVSVWTGLFILENDAFTIFKEWFVSGLDQETVIGELVSCVLPETRGIKRHWIHL